MAVYRNQGYIVQREREREALERFFGRMDENENEKSS